MMGTARRNAALNRALSHQADLASSEKEKPRFLCMPRLIKVSFLVNSSLFLMCSIMSFLAVATSRLSSDCRIL